MAEATAVAPAAGAPATTAAAAAAAGGGGGGGGGGAAASGPRVLILGGCGIVGRNLVAYLLDGGKAASIRVADKRPAFMCYMTREHQAALENPAVDFVQADLSGDEHIPAVFDVSKGAFDVVYCLAAEVAFGASEERYNKTVEIAAKCGAAAAEAGIPRFVYVSTARVYKSQKSASKESAALSPWTTPAQYQLRAEEALGKIAGLNLTIVRPALIYGVGDTHALMPRAVCAAAYTVLGEKMQFLWDSSMRLNTVSMHDVVRALWHLRSAPVGTYNLADKGATDQGKISNILGELFGIKTGFHGKIVSNLARMALDSATDTANEKHMAPWMQLRREHDIENTPLSPFLHIELLRQNHLSVDGSEIEKTGFAYEVPEVTRDGILQMLVGHIKRGLFPPIVPAANEIIAAEKGAATAATAAAGSGGASSA